MSDNMKDMIDFPVLYTFKAMGENNSEFIKNIEQIFCMKQIDSIIKTPSKKGNYVSISVTTEVISYDELQAIYNSIKNTKGIKYHL